MIAPTKLVGIPARAPLKCRHASTVLWGVCVSTYLHIHSTRVGYHWHDHVGNWILILYVFREENKRKINDYFHLFKNENFGKFNQFKILSMRRSAFFTNMFFSLLGRFFCYFFTKNIISKIINILLQFTYFKPCQKLLTWHSQLSWLWSFEMQF